MAAEAGRWDEAAYGPMSLETVGLQFQPAARYRVSWNKYPAGASFNGWSRAGRRYILSGSCRISVAGHSWDLTAGDFADVPGGDFQFSVSGDSSVELISVWELPESFWRAEEDTQAAV